MAGAAHAGSLAPWRAFYSRDLYSFWHPAVESFVRAVSEGAWPVWNPYFGFGEPMAANPNFQVAYPPTWLNLLLPAALSFKLFVLAHTVAGALGVALLARRLRAAVLGAFAAGAAWAAFPPLLSAIGMYHHFAAAAWIPWVLLGVHRALARPGARGAVVLGGAAAGQALAGSADVCFMTALLAAGWTVALLRARRRREPRSWRSAAATVMAATVFAAGLAAVQWLPALAMVPGTARAAPTADTSLYWSLHPLSLLDLAVPRLTAGAAATTAMGPAARARLFESREPLLFSIYMGAPALLAAAAALVTRRHRRTALVLAAAWAAFVLAALGRHTPLLPALLRLPGVAVFRFPPKYLIAAGLPWALLAGLGVDALGRARGRPRWPVAVGMAGGLAAGALALAAVAGALSMPIARALADPLPAAGLLGHVRARLLEAAGLLLAASIPFLLTAAGLPVRAAAAAVAILGALDLARENHAVNPGAPIALVHYRPPIVPRIAAGTDAPRILAFRHPKDWLTSEYVRHPTGWPPRAGWVLGAIDRLSTGIGARWGIRGSYDGDLTGLAPPMMDRLTGRVVELWSSAAGVRWLQLGGVDYVVALDEGVFGGALRPEWQHASVYRRPVRLLRTPGVLPKAFVAPEARTAADDEQALRMLEDPALDPRRTVILARGAAAAAPATSADAPGGEARVVWRRSDATVFEVRAAAPAHLVVLEAFDPAWRASVDGVPAPVLRANLLFRAVPVPPGAHRVELRYRPRPLPWGAALSAAAAVLGLALFKGGRFR